ncbi:hypothetical protein Ancab_038681 [Ancistrocladus abbreviatus]
MDGDCGLSLSNIHKELRSPNYSQDLGDYSGPRTHPGEIEPSIIIKGSEASSHDLSAAVAVNDSQIQSMNGILCEKENSLDCDSSSISLEQIWGFVSQIGVRARSREEEMLQKIEEWEQRDENRYEEMGGRPT